MKRYSKAVAEMVASLCVLPAVIGCLLCQAILGTSRAFPGWSQAFSLLPGLTGAYLRRAFYGFIFDQCGQGSWIGFGTVFSHQGCSIGKNAYVGCYCCLGEVTLEDDVLIASHV